MNSVYPCAESKPILRELSELPVAACWYRLGIQLGVAEDDLDVIEKDYPRDTKLCKVKMFGAWLRSDTSATHEKLIKALVAIGKTSLARQLCGEYGTFIYPVNLRSHAPFILNHSDYVCFNAYHCC